MNLAFTSLIFCLLHAPLFLPVANGNIKRITDGDIQSSVLEIAGTNVSTTYITCPADPKKELGIKLPFLVMIIKNLKKYFTFEVTILDDKNVRRRFRASNYQTTTRVKPFICTMPMRLDEGWNAIQFNLGDFCRRAYATNYIETLRIQIHANCRIRRIYFSDRLYSEDELPPEYKLFLPVQKAAATAGAGGAAHGTQSQHAAAARAAAGGGAARHAPRQPPSMAAAAAAAEGPGDVDRDAVDAYDDAGAAGAHEHGSHADMPVGDEEAPDAGLAGEADAELEGGATPGADESPAGDEGEEAMA